MHHNDAVSECAQLHRLRIQFFVYGSMPTLSGFYANKAVMESAFSPDNYWHDYCTSIYGNLLLGTLRVVEKTNVLWASKINLRIMYE